MSGPAFVCEAQYYGAQWVEGALSPVMLTSLAESILESHQISKAYSKWSASKLPQGEKCQLQIDEERLRVTSSRKDEGFESDPESSSSHEALRGSNEIKVMNDQVLRLDNLLRQDSGIHRSFSSTSEDGGTSSLSSSSGAESEEEISAKNTVVSSKKRNSVQNDFTTIDNFMMCDILFCHVLSTKPTVVVVVVKSVETSLITAHVFECISSEDARTLYSSYHVASNKYKLSRYRNSRRKSDSPEETRYTDNIQVSIRNQVDRHDLAVSRRSSSESTSSYKFGDFPINESNGFHMNTHQAREPPSNVNVIEIRNNHQPNGGIFRNERQGVTRIEIDSAPKSLPPQTSSDGSSVRFIEHESPLIPALERLSIHSSNNPDSYLNYVGVSSSCPNSLIITSREIAAAADKERKSRQRQPPLYIQEEQKRMESLNRKQTHRKSQRRNRSKSEERKPDSVLMFGTEATRSSVHHMSSVMRDEGIIMPPYERQSRGRNASRSREVAGRARSSHTKRQAPPPPPRRHPNNPSLILVPTKTGQENTKSYYPKESHNIRESKVMRIDHPIYPPWNMNSDINNNPQRVYYAPPGWMGSHEYHSSRRNNQYASEMRKRSRSKSPARRPMTHRYIDAVSTFNLSQKLKDFSGSVLQSLKNHPATSHIHNSLNKDEATRLGNRKTKKHSGPLTLAGKEDILRPVIKKTKRDENRRVTFSSYATVQVMDS